MLTTEQIQRDLLAMPDDVLREVWDFAMFLRNQQRKHSTMRHDRECPVTSPLVQESFIGMWQDRQDMSDSSAYVREIRDKEWHHKAEQTHDAD